MHESVMTFARRVLSRQDVAGRAVLEVGAFNMNGSLREWIECLGPRSYTGVDLVLGPGVDLVCDAGQLSDRFGPESFDVVVSTEMLEHASDWHSAVSNMKTVLRPAGLLLLTTRSQGFPVHHAPNDSWRFELSDMVTIFGDMEIMVLESDPGGPGVLLKARRPLNFCERELSHHAVYQVPPQ